MKITFIPFLGLSVSNFRPEVGKRKLFVMKLQFMMMYRILKVVRKRHTLHWGKAIFKLTHFAGMCCKATRVKAVFSKIHFCVFFVCCPYNIFSSWSNILALKQKWFWSSISSIFWVYHVKSEGRTREKWTNTALKKSLSS